MRKKKLFRVVKNFFGSFFGKNGDYMNYDEFLKRYKDYMEQQRIKKMVMRWQQ